MRSKMIVVESAYLSKEITKIVSESPSLSAFRCMATLGRVRDISDVSSTDPMNILNERNLLNDNVYRALSFFYDSDIYIATDNDIEGELIAHDVRDIVKAGNGNDIFRVHIDEVTLQGIALAINNPQEIRQDRVEACLARRGADIAIAQHSPGAGRILSRGLASVHLQSDNYEEERLVAEINLSGKNTLSTMVEMSLLGHKPKEVSLSLQKMYSQGRITYPRTLSGISHQRNHLHAMEDHGEIVIVDRDGQPRQYDNPLDEKILNYLRSSPFETAMSRYPAGAKDGRHTKSLLELYQMPYSRASTLSHHSERLVSLMTESGGLSKQGWRLLDQAQKDYPVLCSERGSLKVNDLLHFGDNDHKERIEKAISMLTSSRVDESTGVGKFRYPVEDIGTPQPSPMD